ncbi:hypothetical protein N7534_007500 [Penicillium rubens]|nr:hypothetical protein N7534_007500 [Penicillium rubens]
MVDAPVGNCNYFAILSNVYLLSLEYTATESSLPTRPGQVSSTIAHAVHNVSQAGQGTTLEVLANLIQAQKPVNNGNASTRFIPDPLNLIMMADEFKEKIVFNGLIYIVVALMFICFLLLSTFPGWHEEVGDDGDERQVKPFPSEAALLASLLAASASSGFGLITILWQHVNSSATATMAEILTYGAVSGHVGGVAMTLGWLSIGLIVLVCVGLWALKLSISLITSLTRE